MNVAEATKIKPAMSAEDWAARSPIIDGEMTWVDDDGSPVVWTPAERHGLAARCMLGQPFGFTREQVQLLRDSVDWPDDDDPLLRLADILESYLPPES